MELAASEIKHHDDIGATPDQRESQSMRAVNTTMRERSTSLSPSDSVPFFCECKDPACFGGIWMSVGVFDARVGAESGWLLLEGHEPSGLWYRTSPVPTRQTVRSRTAPPAGKSAFGLARPRGAAGLQLAPVSDPVSGAAA